MPSRLLFNARRPRFSQQLFDYVVAGKRRGRLSEGGSWGFQTEQQGKGIATTRHWSIATMGSRRERIERVTSAAEAAGGTSQAFDEGASDD